MGATGYFGAQGGVAAPSTGVVKKPAPTTWQDQEYQDATAAWNAQGANVYGAETTAAAGQAAAVGQSGAALARVNAFAPTNLQGYNPTDLAGYNVSKTLTGPSGTASALAGSYAGSGSPSVMGVGGAPGGAAGFADAKAAATASMNFDPTSYGTTFAQGAETQFNTDLTTQLDQLQRNSAGTGRLETGFYTGDEGTVATNLGKDFNSKIAQAATTFSGQKLSALQGGAAALTGIDQNIATDAQAATNEVDYKNLTQQQTAVSAKLAEEGMSVGEQEEAASLGLSQAQMLAQLGMQKATSLDQFGQNTVNTGLQAALSEEQMARSSYSSAASAAGAYTSASRDWAAQDKQTQDQIDFETALAKYLAGMGGKPTGPGGPNLPPGTTGASGPNQADPYAWLKAEAAGLGVPFAG